MCHAHLRGHLRHTEKLTVQRTFRTRHIAHTRVGLDSHPQGTRDALEDSFADVMGITSVV